MHRINFILISGCLIVGCGGGGVATSAGDTSAGTGGTTAEPTSSTTAPTSSSTSTGDTGTGGATEGNSATGTGSTTEVTAGTTGEAGTGTTGGETTGETTGTGTTGGDTSTGDTSTGETTGDAVRGCGFIGPQVEATLVHLDAPEPPCGTLEFEGRLEGPGVGPAYALDSCPCDAGCLQPDPWDFTIDVPEMLLPQPMPQCPRIVVERMLSKGMGCELVGAAVFDTKAPMPEVPVWVAGSLLGPLDAVKSQIQVVAKVVEECECDSCCNTPQRYDLEFLALEDMVTVPEDEFGSVGGNEMFYAIRNFQSNFSGYCDASPSIDWVMQLQFAP